MTSDVTARIADILRREIRTGLGLKSGDYMPAEVFEHAAEQIVAQLKLTPETTIGFYTNNWPLLVTGNCKPVKTASMQRFSTPWVVVEGEK